SGVVTGGDVRMGINEDRWIDTNGDARHRPERSRALRDAPELHHTLDLERQNVLPDSEIDLIIPLGDATQHNLPRTHPEPPGEQQLSCGNGVDACPCFRNGAHDASGAVGFYGESNEVRSRAKS